MSLFGCTEEIGSYGVNLSLKLRSSASPRSRDLRKALTRNTPYSRFLYETSLQWSEHNSITLKCWRIWGRGIQQKLYFCKSEIRSTLSWDVQGAGDISLAYMARGRYFLGRDEDFLWSRVLCEYFAISRCAHSGGSTKIDVGLTVLAKYRFAIIGRFLRTFLCQWNDITIPHVSWLSIALCDEPVASIP